MDVLEDIKASDNQAFERWFDRWFESENFINTFKKSAQQGYTSYSIELARTTPLSEKEAYINRRLRDPRTVNKLKEQLSGIGVKFVVQNKRGLFGLNYTVEKLVFSWNG